MTRLLAVAVLAALSPAQIHLVGFLPLLEPLRSCDGCYLTVDGDTAPSPKPIKDQGVTVGELTLTVPGMASGSCTLDHDIPECAQSEPCSFEQMHLTGTLVLGQSAIDIEVQVVGDAAGPAILHLTPEFAPQWPSIAVPLDSNPGGTGGHAVPWEQIACGGFLVVKAEPAVLPPQTITWVLSCSPCVGDQ